MTKANLVRKYTAQLLRTCSFEITPKQTNRIPEFASHLARATQVSVTCLTGHVSEDTVKACVSLREHGLVPVPHVAARAFKSLDHFHDFMKHLTIPVEHGGAGVDRIILIAGGDETPLGPFRDTLQLLDTGVFEEVGIKHILFAGHPEGNPVVDNLLSDEALKYKNQWIAERENIRGGLVTQFCFSSHNIVNWVKRIRSQGNKLHVSVGVAGPTKLSTLLRYAQWAGVSASTKQLSSRPMDMMRVASSDPSVLVKDIVECALEENVLEPGNYDKGGMISDLHFYTFGGLIKTANWAENLKLEHES